MKKFHHYNSGRNRGQYKWSSQNTSNINSVNKVYVAPTTNPGHGKLVSQYQTNSPAPSNGLTNRHHKINSYFHNHTKFGSSSRQSKYVFVSNSNDKEKVAKSVVSKPPVQPEINEIQHKSTKKLTSSRNDVFRFTSAPKTASKPPVKPEMNEIQHKSTKKLTSSRNDVFRFTSAPKTACNLATKSSTTEQGCCKNTDDLKPTATVPTTSIHQRKFNKKKNHVIIPSRSQLRWTSKDNVDTTTHSATKPQVPNTPMASKRLSPKQPSSTRSRFTWRRSSSGATRRRLSSSLSNHANTRYKHIKPSPVIHKKFPQRRSSFNSVRKIVYIGGIAYNATARRLSRRLSSGSSKKKLAVKNIKKTGNKVWIPEHHPGEPAEESFVHPGYEIRRKKGNWQWIAGNKSALSRQANAIKHKYVACKSQLFSHPSKHRANFLKVFIKNDVFIMDPSKRRLRRLSRTSLGGDSKRRVSGSVPSRTPTHQLASHVVRRSKALVWHAARKKKNVPKSEQYCMFFNRFGKCSRQDTCPYIHDPDKIAVCTRFLRGTCDKTDGTCPFSHQITKEKMPVCSYFLRGVCTKDGCPYLHVYVGENAEICQDFVKGFCPNGDKCNKKHLLDCPDFTVSGECSKGDKCLLRHKKRVCKRQSSFTKAESKEPKAFKRRRIVNQTMTNNQKDNSDSIITDTLITPEQLEFIPLEQGPSTPPDFIAL